jgi:hypothetical protein
MQRAFVFGIVTLVMLVASDGRAGQITDLQLYDGGASPTATIHYTNADGTGSNSAYVYADPQLSGGTTSPLYYCVDLWHDNYVGQSYTITPVASIAFGASTFGDADNRIAWLLTQDQGTADARAAVQLAIWYTVDSKGFSMQTGDSAITGIYNSLITFAGYQSGTDYSAQFWKATHDASNTLYQDLVSAPSLGSSAVSTVPEPGSLVLGSLGVILVGGWRLARGRRRSSAGSQV